MAIFGVRRAVLLLAAGVPLILGGCATRGSVERAQASANLADQHALAADQHAAAADGHAADAHAAADQAAATGNSALSAAQTADQKASAAQAGLAKANARIAYLERKLLPKRRHKRPIHHVHHTTSGQTTTGTSNGSTAKSHSGT